MAAHDDIEARIAALEAWLRNVAPDIADEQKHLDVDTPERAYWHYGYLVALRDVRDLLTRSVQ